MLKKRGGREREVMEGGWEVSGTDEEQGLRIRRGGWGKLG